MESQIQQLEARYSTAHDYSTLSQEQVAFLLDPNNMGNTSSSGDLTVSVRGIHSDPDVGTLVDVVDVFHYLFGKNNPGAAGHRHNRLPIARSHFGTEIELEDGTYLFELLGGNKVRIEYDSVKDKP